MMRMKPAISQARDGSMGATEIVLLGDYPTLGPLPPHQASKPGTDHGFFLQAARFRAANPGDSRAQRGMAWEDRAGWTSTLRDYVHDAAAYDGDAARQRYSGDT